VWLGVAASAIASGTMIGWVIETIPVESLTVGDWMRSLAWGAVALIAPVVGAAAAVAPARVPSFTRILAHRGERTVGPLALTLGVLLIVLTLLALQAALGLVFDPRYRDFPFAALTAAVVPFALLTLRPPRRKDLAVSAETVAAATLALSAVYVALNETLANWQAAWFAAGLIVLAATLASARDAPGSK